MTYGRYSLRVEGRTGFEKVFEGQFARDPRCKVQQVTLGIVRVWSDDLEVLRDAAMALDLERLGHDGLVTRLILED